MRIKERRFLALGGMYTRHGNAGVNVKVDFGYTCPSELIVDWAAAREVAPSDETARRIPSAD